MRAQSADEVGDYYTAGLCYIHLERDRIAIYSERALNHLKKALECGEKTRDIYLKAIALGFLAHGTYWKAFTTEDPDQRIETADEAMEFYDKAQNLLKLLSIQIPYGGKICKPAPGGYAEYYLDRAMWETNPSKKLELLEKSEKDGLKTSTVATDWARAHRTRLSSSSDSRPYGILLSPIPPRTRSHPPRPRARNQPSSSSKK